MKLKSLLRKKIIIPAILILLVGGVVLAKKGDKNSQILTERVVKVDLQKTVLATGQVLSAVDLGLGFKTGGIVKSVSVKVGDKAKAGQILASLNQSNELASLKSSQASLSQARSNYQKVLEGATGPEVAVAEAALNSAEVALQNAKEDLAQVSAEQEILVSNSYRKLLNTDTSAIDINRYDTSATLTVTGTYTDEAEGEYRIKLQNTGLSSFYFQAFGLENDSKSITKGTPLSLGTRGLYLTFSTTGDFSPVDEWVIRIPNKASSNYVTNYNAYLAATETQKSALSSANSATSAAEATVNQKKAELVLKKSQARPSEIEFAKAQVLAAEAQVESALAALENTIIRAPVSGTVTKVDIKVGEQATTLALALSIQDIDNLYLEANISEANIANLKIGQEVTASFDALGQDKIYKATLQFIDPASTSVSGIVNYKIKASLLPLPEIRQGLTANMSILTAKESGVLAVPLRAIENRDGKKMVRIITNSKEKTYRDQEVTTGLVADGGQVQILSGLSEGQEVVTSLGQLE